MPLNEAYLRAHTTPEEGFEEFGKRIFELIMASAVHTVESRQGEDIDNLQIPLSINLVEAKTKKCVGITISTSIGHIGGHVNVDV